LGVEQDSLLALRYGALDLIVGGHSHTKLDTGMLVNGVLITQAERYVNYVGKTIVKFKNGKVVSKRNRLVNVAQLRQKDTLVSQKIEAYNNTPELQQVMGTLKQAIVKKFDIGNFFCDAVCAQANADITFQNKGGVRIDTLHKVKVTKKELYNADPFGNKIVIVEMTGKEVLEFISSVYSRFQGLDLCVSGISYRIMVKDGSATATARLANGKMLDLFEKYSVAMNSYMATKPGDYPLPSRCARQTLSLSTVDAVEQYMKQQKAISFASPVRAEVKVE
jgi:2',3'-cyclic-nucleotide 2'-phosphodiesterase (5'-nucleotidase family)